MPVVKQKPTSPGRRGMVRVVSPDLYKGRSIASLTKPKTASNGRNSAGRITVRHRGGGHKHHYRVVDFKRNKDSVAARVERLEYDPNRSAHIALLLYADGERRYIIAPKGLKVNDAVSSGSDAPIRTGNTLPIKNIPVGTVVHCLELVEMEVRDLLSSYDFPGDDTPIVTGSALKALEGDESDIGAAAIVALAEALDSYIPEPERAIDGAFLMPIEDVFSISGRGTVVTGRIERGVVKVGEEVEIIGIKDTEKTTCTGVEMFRKLLDEGQAGDNVGVLLRGTKQTVSDCGSTPPTAQKTLTAPSNTLSDRSTSIVKSTWPGVSIMLIRCSS